ncbi:MAG: response regulator transcription factor [Clostridiales bacterium]|nr:response regulator transcription factor [Candidatus Blautia equi]
MIKVMLVEDEEKIRHILKKMIEKVEGFQVTAEAESFAAAISQFSVERPDVVFVDVDLNGDSGLECAKVMVNLDPKLKVIFATAHSEYMANAFEIYAFDYLVKPFDMERLHRTLRRIQAAGDVQDSGRAAVVSHSDREKENGRLMIKGKEQILFVDKKDIAFVEHAESTTLVVTQKETYKCSTSLSELEQKLTGDFMRSHRSYIINTSMISKMEPYGRWTYVVHFNGIKETALITSQKYEELKNLYL